ncbi:MAG: hypothetical protein JO214_03550 [Frankiaceae bacterium]|nr:hypothetical protein [Frankiaceae bacterium]
MLDLSTAEQGPDFARHYLALGRAFLDSRNVSEGTDCYLQSAAFARHVESAMSVEIICELGARLTRLENYDAAIDLLINEIASRPIDGALWHRLGVIYWYADRLIDAYAALSTALANGAGRARVAHARGQVLNEMGEYHLARNELEIALEDPLTVVSASYARAAHAYALYMLGNTGEGESEFSEAEQITPGNAWLHWLRGLAAERMGDTRGAAERFSRSLVENAPPLNSAKRVYALRYLQMYNRR